MYPVKFCRIYLIVNKFRCNYCFEPDLSYKGSQRNSQCEGSETQKYRPSFFIMLLSLNTKRKNFTQIQSLMVNSDAFRHYVWSGLLVRDVGEDSAREFLNAHEAARGQSASEKAI